MNTEKTPDYHPDAEIIALLGGATRVARLLGYDPDGGRQRVVNWRKTGIPASVKLEHPNLFLRDIKIDRRKPLPVPKPGKPREVPPIFVDIQPKARNTDPVTSHQAAERAQAFAGSQAQRVLRALENGPATAETISRLSGLTVVQVCRRLPDLKERGQAEPTEKQVGDFRVWRKL